jgi:lipopolysaccharide export system permease protein
MGNSFMPILWRYLLGQYFRVLILTVISIIAALMVTRLDEVAEFAILGAQGSFVFLYAMYQIPYVLPIALPIAALVSATLLYQRLSTTHEITAMRSAGIPIRQVLAPVLIASLGLSLADLYVISEVSTSSHLATKRMEHEMRTLSPMLLLQNRQLLRHRGFFVDVLGKLSEDRAEDVLLASADKDSGRMNIVTARSLSFEEGSLNSTDTSILFSIPSADIDAYDHLLIENLSATSTPAGAFTQQFKNDGWRLNRDHLGMSLLLLHLEHESRDYERALAEGEDPSFIAHLGRRVSRCYSEVSRRLSLALAVFTFSLMGTAFGIDISRHRGRSRIVTVVALAALYLTCFFTAKAKDAHFYLATALLTLPHLLIIGLSVRSLRRLTLGIES